AEIVFKRAPELKQKIKIVYNPLPEVSGITKKPSDPTFLYLSGDGYFKGFHIFLKASACTLQKGFKRNSNVQFLITKDLRDISKLAVEKLNVRFNRAYDLLGYLAYEEVLKLHSISRALLFPSIWEEPLPYTVIESMLAGTIPIASRVGGVPEIVNGTFAERMLFEPDNVEKLIDKMESVLSLSMEQIIDIGKSLRENILKQFNSYTIRKQLRSIVICD
ncbi:MAG: glycosyltransferase family 4 protein, partial [Candidatus Jordarchaeaceae archaeon]